MMRHEGAAAVLRQCTADIRNFSEPAYAPQEADFSGLPIASRWSVSLSMRCSTGPTTSTVFVSNMQSGTTRQPVDDESAATVEQELEQQKRETHGLLAALKEQPSDTGLRQEVQQNLAALQKDADLVADKKLGQQTKHVLSALAAGGDAARQIDEAMATLELTADTGNPATLGGNNPALAGDARGSRCRVARDIP